MTIDSSGAIPTQSLNTLPSNPDQILTPVSDKRTAKMVDHSEKYWLILQKNVEWLRFSETKSAIILSSYGILLTIFYTNAADVFNSVIPIGIVTLLVVIFAVLSLSSIIFSFLSLVPRLKNPGNSILYFGHIATNYPDAKSYRQAAHLILDDEDQYANHLAEQIYSISEIAKSKYKWTGLSMWFFFVSICILLLTVGIYFFQNLNALVR